MIGFKTLFKKEWSEGIRTYRFFIVGGVFILFGMTTPILLKYLPQLIALSGENIGIDVPPPTAVQSLTEYIGTMLQFGILSAILVGMGAIASERERGTAAMTLSKPVSRSAFILAKLCALSLSFVIALAVASAGAFFYTDLLIEPGNLSGFIAASSLLALFFIFAIALTLYFSSLFKSAMAAGALSLATILGLAAVTNLPWVGDFMPGRLTGWSNALISGSPGYQWWAVVATVLYIAVLVWLAKLSLDKKEL